MEPRRYPLLAFLLFVLTLRSSPPVQVNSQLAETYFKEAAALCEREAGQLWGMSLCGPLVFADATTKTIAANQRVPEAPRPAFLGFANTAAEWGGTRWSTVVWQMIPANPQTRGRMLIHELFHRVQVELGLFTNDGQNGHLDTLNGRYWIQLEWRALASALRAEGSARATALRDALSFRAARRREFSAAASNEQLEEIREGLAQYTGTIAAAAAKQAAIDDTIVQLQEAAAAPSFVRTFAYPLGAAYGILLDAYSPGWTRRIKAADDLGVMVSAAAGVQPLEVSPDMTARYGGAELKTAEEKRDAEHQARVAELRRKFVEGPVLIVSGAGGSFRTAGVTAIPGAGTVYPSVNVTAEWGALEADWALRSIDQRTIALPAPTDTSRSPLTGEGWTLRLAPGWVVRPGSRAGDFRLVREPE